MSNKLLATDPRPRETDNGYYILDLGTEIECPVCGKFWSAESVSATVISPFTRNRYCSIWCWFEGQGPW